MNVDLVSRTTSGEWTNLLDREQASEREAAFALLVTRQSRFVFKIAYAVLRNVEDAEDVAQETFLKLFRTRAWLQIQDEKSFLARMTWRLAVSRKPKTVSIDARQPANIASSDSSPETEAILTERSRTIHRLIDALPEKLRMPLALSSIEEMTTPEIAAIMDAPEGTVRRLLVDARVLLRAKLARLEGQQR